MPRKTINMLTNGQNSRITVVYFKLQNLVQQKSSPDHLPLVSKEHSAAVSPPDGAIYKADLCKRPAIAPAFIHRIMETTVKF